jgi:hypothetical protein
MNPSCPSCGHENCPKRLTEGKRAGLAWLSIILLLGLIGILTHAGTRLPKGGFGEIVGLAIGGGCIVTFLIVVYFTENIFKCPECRKLFWMG